MNECLRYLLHKQGTVRNFEFNSSLYLLVLFFLVEHHLLGHRHRNLTLFLEISRSANKSGGALDSLLHTVLLVNPHELILDFQVLVLLFIYHLLTTFCDICIVLFGGSGLFNVRVAHNRHLSKRIRSALHPECRIDDLVGIIHEGAQFCTWFRLMEVERLRYRRSHALLSLLHLGDKCLLQSLEVRH